MALKVGELIVANELPDYIYNQAKAVVEWANPVAPADLPDDAEGLRAYLITREQFFAELRQRVDSLFAVWFTQKGQVACAEYMRNLLANVFTMLSRVRRLTIQRTYDKSMGEQYRTQPVTEEFTVIFWKGDGTIVGHQTYNQPKPIMPNEYAISPLLSLGAYLTSNRVKEVTSEERGFTPENIGAMPENYALYAAAQTQKFATALKASELITLSLSFKQVVEQFVSLAKELISSFTMPGSESFSRQNNVPGLGTPTQSGGIITYPIPGFVNTNNAATYGIYKCHASCHGNCRHRSWR